MYRRLRLSFLLMIMASASMALAQEVSVEDLFKRYGEIYVEVKSPRPAELRKLQTEYVVSRWFSDRLEVCLNPLEFVRFKEEGYAWKLLIPSRPKTKYMAESMEEAREYYYYPKYPQYVQLMLEYASGFPGLVRLDTIGDTPNGHQVLAVRITSGAKEGNKPKVFYTASMHGNETPCFPMMLHLIDTLLNSYGSDEGITELLDSAEVFINPLSNPDGMFRLYDTTILDASRYNSEGKDLNRNFPDPSYSASFVPPPENQDMIAYMKEHRFVLSANFHTGFTVMNYPYDRTYTPHADHDWFDYICREYADTVHTINPAYMTSYDNGVVQGSDWFVIRGSRQDFITGYLQGREVTVELDGAKMSSPARADELWNINKASLVHYLRQVLYGIQGMIYDEESGEPVPARIEIPGHDADSSHVYSDSTTGFYTRLLEAGSWDLQVTAEGYRDTLIEGVILQNRCKTLLDIAMKKQNTAVITPVSLRRLSIHPNPARDHFTVHLPEHVSRGEVSMYTSSGRKVGHYAFGQAGRPVRMAVAGVPPGIYYVYVTAMQYHAAGKVIILPQ